MAVYDDIMASLKELADHAEGKKTSVVIHRMSVANVKEYSPERIKAIRKEAGLTQKLFAACIGVSTKSVEAWEGGRSRPDGAARRLIGMMESDPSFVQNYGILTVNE